MKFSIAILAALTATTNAAQACTRDACYNNVAVQSARNPGLASRKADCSSVLRTVIDDDKTVTVTVRATTTTSAETTTTSTTAATTTSSSTSTVRETVTRTTSIVVTSTTTTTTTSTSATSGTDFVKRLLGHRPSAVPPIEDGYEESELEARDIIVASKNKPAYAVNCKDAQAYAIACLCFGVKAMVIKNPQRTTTVTTTLTGTVTSTASLTATSGVTVSSTSTITSVATFVISTSYTTVTTSSTSEQCFLAKRAFERVGQMTAGFQDLYYGRMEPKGK